MLSAAQRCSFLPSSLLVCEGSSGVGGVWFFSRHTVYLAWHSCSALYRRNRVLLFLILTPLISNDLWNMFVHLRGLWSPSTCNTWNTATLWLSIRFLLGCYDEQRQEVVTRSDRKSTLIEELSGSTGRSVQWEFIYFLLSLGHSVSQM